jgi:DNA-binding NtrC family response regulator
VARVLVVEDQSFLAKTIGLLLEVHGFSSCHASTSQEALALLEQESVDLVIQEMTLGATLFRQVKALDPHLPVLILTDLDKLETASRLVKEGTADYLAQPWDDNQLMVSVHNLIRLRNKQEERRTIKAQMRRVRGELAERHQLLGLVYESDIMNEIVETAVRLARTDDPLLITGGNGSGKRKIAEIIHANSDRRVNPLVLIETEARQSTAINAELFGAEAGAMSPEEKVGALETAAGGTVLIGEVDKLSPAGQMKILRVLQSGHYERLGSTLTKSTDARIIATSSANLRQAIIRGTFRDDLFFSLALNQIELPNLSDRPEDTLTLANHFLQQMTPEAQSPPILSEAARLCLVNHDWPGNVRELQERISKASREAAGKEITPADLGLKPVQLSATD